jgi:hypothetical protein
MNLGFFLTPKETYYQTTSVILGKMYSNSMMVVLNSRMVYGIINDTLSSEVINPVFSISHGGISVTREQWTEPVPLKDFKVSIAITNLDIDN